MDETEACLKILRGHLLEDSTEGCLKQVPIPRQYFTGLRCKIESETGCPYSKNPMYWVRVDLPVDAPHEHRRFWAERHHLYSAPCGVCSLRPEGNWLLILAEEFEEPFDINAILDRFGWWRKMSRGKRYFTCWDCSRPSQHLSVVP